MSRLTQPTSKIIALVVAVLVIAGGASYDVAVHHQAPKPAVATTKPAPTTQLTYHGQEGKNALDLLKQHANKVETKSSSLGDYVTAINGNNGGGKKYWIFYVNGKESQVGASAYVTHSSDVIQWKLQ